MPSYYSEEKCMGIISKTVKVKWYPCNKKYYESKGYVYTKMGDEFEVKVEDLQSSSKIKVVYKCDECGIEKERAYYNYLKQKRKDNKTFCSPCANKIIGKKLRVKNMTKSLEQWCIENNRQDVLDRWDYELNNCSPSEVGYGSGVPRWFKCLLHPEHKSELKYPYKITENKEDSLKCNQCNSIGQYIIDNYNEEFLWKVWSNKNDKSPFEIPSKSLKKYWWNCPDSEHESFERDCVNSIYCEFRCSECSKTREESMYEEKARLYLEELGYEVKTEWKCSLIIKNPTNNKSYFRFDNEIILENGKHLIIEVHGEQHYKIGNYTKTKEELQQRKLIDRYKRIKCIQSGYEYLELPYIAFNNEETYKKLIDDKIKEILTNNYK